MIWSVCLWLALVVTSRSLPITRNLNDYASKGCKSDGVSSCTAAIKSAIADIAAGGGGTLVVPAGKWVTGPFNLTSGLTLQVDGTLLASTAVADYFLIAALPSYGTGRDVKGACYHPVILGYAVTDVTITGTGVIDGQGSVYWWTKVGKVNRPQLVQFQNSSSIIITGVTLQNSPFWTLHLWNSQHIHVHHVTITAPQPSNSVNTDGIDIDSSSDVLVEHNTINSGDDAVAIKSGWDDPGIAFGVPTQNVLVQQNTISTPYHGCLTIGSEVSGSVKNVTFTTNTLTNCKYALRVKSGDGRGGELTDIHFNTNSVATAGTAIQFDMTYGAKNPNPMGHTPGKYPDVHAIYIKGLTVDTAKHMLELTGLTDKPMTNLNFADVAGPPKARFTCNGGYSGLIYTNFSPAPVAACQA